MPINTPMTLDDVFHRLVAMAAATNGGARGATVLSCDMLHQESLYQLQEALASLLADVANACGPAAASRLKQEFPYAFARR